MSEYTLPDGSTTTNDEQYIREWQSTAQRIERALDVTVIASNPGFQIADKDGAVTSVPMWLVRKIIGITEERDEARWEVCGFHHLTGFLAGDYANSRGWNYFNDENNRKNRQGFPKSVHDFDAYLKRQDKVLLEIIERLRSDLRNSRIANEANTNNTLFREGKL